MDLVRYPEKNFTVKQYLITLNPFWACSPGLVPTPVVVVARTTIKIEQGPANNAIMGWHQEQPLSHRATAGDGTAYHVPPSTTLPWASSTPMINVGPMCYPDI